MKKVKEIKEELGHATVTLKGGLTQKVVTKTTYTYYEDGTNDCTVEMQKPIGG